MKRGIEVENTYDRGGNYVMIIRKARGKLTLDEIREAAMEYEQDYYGLVMKCMDEDMDQYYDDDLLGEMERQVEIVYSAAAIALHRHYRWGQKRILQLIEETKAIWNDCARDPDTSMVMMLEQETGIEIRARGVDKSFHELDFLVGTVADAHPMAPPEYILMRRRQLQWVNPQITAALLLALHRLHGWSGVRDKRMLDLKDEVEAEYGWKPARLIKACREETGINIVEETER